MGCTSSHQEPTKLEFELSKVYSLLDELNNGELGKYFRSGCDPRVYNKRLNSDHLNEKTAELCTTLQNTDVTKLSLEMQIWWRDHQQHDRDRVEAEIRAHQTEEERQVALAKLTPYERELLKIK